MKRASLLFLVIVLSGCIKRPEMKPPGVEPETLFSTALKYYSAGEWIKADSTFKKVIISTKDKALIGKSYYYLGSVNEKLKRMRSALVYYSNAYELGYGDRSAFILFMQKISPSILDREFKRIPESLKPEALYIMGNNYLKEGEEGKGLGAFRKLSSMYPKHPLTVKVRKFLESGKKYRVAVILPFSGSLADVAEIIRNSIEENRSPDVYYIYFDNRGSPTLTYKIIRKVVKKGYSGVIGPLLSNNSVVASVICNMNSTPMVSPTATSALVDSFGPYGLTLNKALILEGYAIAEYALNTLGFRKAALLYPANDYGKRPTRAFKDYFTKNGGKIVYEGMYISGEKNFRSMLRAINKSGADMVFIPGSSDDLLSLVPQLKYFSVKMQILGGDGWNSEKMIKEIGAAYFEGVVFAGLLYRDRNEKEVDESKRLAALGRDAVKVIEAMVKGKSPEDVANSLIAGSVYLEEDIQNVPLYIISGGKFERIR